MDLSEATQLLTWLDEEHRRDKAQLAELQQQAEARAAEILDLTKRLEDLEGRLASTQAQLVKFPQIEEALQQLKGEIVGLLEEQEAKRQQAEETLRQRAEEQAADLTGLAKGLQEVKDELARAQAQLAQLPPRLDAQATQTAGVAKALQGLQEGLTKAQARTVELGQRIADQAEQFTNLARELQGLEGQLASTQAQLVKFPQIEEALQHLKNEIVLLIQETETRRQEAEEEEARARQLDRENTAKALAELEKRLEVLPRLEERLQAQGLEDKRLGEILLGLQGEMARLTEQAEAHGAKLEYLEAWSQRSAQEMADLRAFEEQLKRDHLELAEAMRLSEDRRQKQMAAWAQEMEEQRQQREQWTTQMHHFEEVHGAAERTLAAIQEVKKKVEQDIGEIREVQRLSLLRQQEAMKAWQEEDAKRWGQRASEWQWHREKQDERNEEHARRIEELEAQCRELQGRIAELWRAQDEFTRSQMIEVQQRLEKIGEHLPRARVKRPKSGG
ncbi:MAG: hypothetical protein ACE5MB_03215 [Anaerolineae bacterium]